MQEFQSTSLEGIFRLRKISKGIAQAVRVSGKVVRKLPAGSAACFSPESLSTGGDQEIALPLEVVRSSNRGIPQVIS